MEQKQYPLPSFHDKYAPTRPNFSPGGFRVPYGGGAGPFPRPPPCPWGVPPSPYGQDPRFASPRFPAHVPHFRPVHQQRFEKRGFHNRKRNQMHKIEKEGKQNFNFFCDSCDKGFKTEEKFTDHVTSHQKCHVEGCSYVAAPKLIKLHFALQHRTGLAKKIWQLESKDDIAKWRAERKRNYPTAENVARKKSLREERLSRGEVLETRSFGKMKRGQNRNNENRFCADGDKRNQRRRKRKHQNRGSFPDQKKVKVEEEQRLPPVISNKAPAGDPLSYVLESGDVSDEDVQQMEQPAGKSQAVGLPAVGLQGGLGSLMSSYGDITDSEEENEKEKTVIVRRTKQILKSNPENKRTFSGEGKRDQKNGNRKDKNVKKSELSYRKRATLLEKLLAPEIRHERNIILQCVHYIVKKNFFEKSAKPAEMISAQRTAEDEQTDTVPPDIDDEIWENVSHTTDD